MEFKTDLGPPSKCKSHPIFLTRMWLQSIDPVADARIGKRKVERMIASEGFCILMVGRGFRSSAREWRERLMAEGEVCWI